MQEISIRKGLNSSQRADWIITPIRPKKKIITPMGTRGKG